jgi:AcrR family transcriptional regulator
MARIAAAKANGEENKGRKASKAFRRQQLIDATIDCLAEWGYAETTLARVSDRAGLSRGIVNFHFESKENLLIATLQHLADEYAANWSDAVNRAGPAPQDRLQALVRADFNRTVNTRRKLAAWCAFWGEARSRPTYNALCGARNDAFHLLVNELFRQLVEDGGYAGDPTLIALSFDCLLEGLWLRLTVAPQDITLDSAREAAMEFLRSAFPAHFPRMKHDDPSGDTA